MGRRMKETVDVGGPAAPPTPVEPAAAGSETPPAPAPKASKRAPAPEPDKA